MAVIQNIARIAAISTLLLITGIITYLAIHSS